MPDLLFGNHSPGLGAPAVGAFAITPGAAEFAQWTRAIWVGTGGDIAVEFPDGTSAVFANVASGTLLPFRARRVLVAGTTAAGLIGLY